MEHLETNFEERFIKHLEDSINDDYLVSIASSWHNIFLLNAFISHTNMQTTTNLSNANLFAEHISSDTNKEYYFSWLF